MRDRVSAWRPLLETAHRERTASAAPDQGPSGRRNGQAGHRIFGSRTSPAESEASAGALPPARKELRFRKRSGRTGFRSGSCEPGVDPGLRLMAMPRRNQGFGRGSCRTRFRGLRPMKTGMARKRDASSKSAERRTARASALTGSQRGNRKGFGPDGLREAVGSGFRS
jgi:hypothetical protein